MGRQPDCYCRTCDRPFHHLGIASHRAAHRNRKENCVIEYSDGQEIAHWFSKPIYFPTKANSEVSTPSWYDRKPIPLAVSSEDIAAATKAHKAKEEKTQ